MTSTSALIISGGDVDVAFSGKRAYDLVIAVDAGLESAEQMGITPDVILGDFDTVDAAVLDKYAGRPEIEIVRLKPEKDATDTETAILYAMNHGVKEIDILGGTGTRLDHTLSNCFMLKMAYEQGVMAYMYTGLSKIYIISGTKHYRKADFFGKYISFIQFDGSAKAVTLKGFKYDVTEFDFDTKKTYRLGISNEPLEEEASVEMAEGFLLVVESLEDKD